jgi:PEP-CTERM motif
MSLDRVSGLLLFVNPIATTSQRRRLRMFESPRTFARQVTPEAAKEIASKSRKLLVPVLLSLLLLIPSVVEGLNIGLSFTGSSLLTSGFIPPDTMGAVGPDHFVELINGQYAVYRNTDGARVQTSTLNDFWRNAGIVPTGSFAFDPRVTYDASSGHWFAASADNSGQPNNFLVAVSNSSDPSQGWKGFAIPSDSAKSRWADFPTLGVNRDGVYLAANMFPTTGSFATSVLVLPKADLIAGTVTHRTLFENVSPGSTGSSIQPVTDPKSTGVPVATLLSDFNTGGGLFKRSDIVGSVTSPGLDTANKFITVPPFGGPPNAQQPGPKAPLEAGDTRLSSSVVMRNGDLWGVQSVNSGGRSALRWFDIDAATNTLRQSGLIASPTLAFYYGSIAVNDFGHVVIGFSGSGPSQFVSAYAVEGQTTNGVTTFGDPLFLKAGVSDYEVTFGAGRNRWGDYSATVLDPDDPYRFWTIQEWVSGTNIWSTQITELDTVPEPTTLLLFGTTAAGLGLARWRRRKQG